MGLNLLSIAQGNFEAKQGLDQAGESKEKTPSLFILLRSEQGYGCVPMGSIWANGTTEPLLGAYNCPPVSSLSPSSGMPYLPSGNTKHRYDWKTASCNTNHFPKLFLETPPDQDPPSAPGTHGNPLSCRAPPTGPCPPSSSREVAPSRTITQSPEFCFIFFSPVDMAGSSQLALAPGA